MDTQKVCIDLFLFFIFIINNLYTAISKYMCGPLGPAKAPTREVSNIIKEGEKGQVLGILHGQDACTKTGASVPRQRDTKMGP